MFETIVGNEHVKCFLTQLVTQNKMPHALLFSGQRGVGKKLFAHELAAYLLDAQKTPGRIASHSHPDFYVFYPEKKSGVHSIEAFRSLTDATQMTPLEARAKVFVIEEAERMTFPAANALLKTLEEPCLHSVIILLTDRSQELLPTIRSRCCQVRFSPLMPEEIAAILHQNHIAHEHISSAHGSVEKAVRRADNAKWLSLLFSLLEKQHTLPHNAHIALKEIELLEKEIAHDDPVEHNKAIEDVLECILMWHRDQYMRSLQCAPKFLFFPQASSVSNARSLEEIEKKLDQTRSALARNIRFSTCLEAILFDSSSNFF